MLSGSLRSLFAALFLIAAAAPGFAQTGKISGRVTDAATGEPLPGVNVVIVERWVGGVAVPAPDPRGAATDPEGYYSILNIPPGTYNVRASFVGFSSVTMTEIPVNSGLTTDLDFLLREEIIEGEGIEIVAQRDVVRPDIASTVEFISPERMTQSPTQRLDEFVGKIKGVQLVSGDEGHGLSIRGGSIRETDIRIDGLSVRDPRSGNSYLNFNTATIEEIQVQTGGFEARHGGIQSGLVNVVTKDGSRDRFTATLSIDYAPAGQKRYFGTGAWEPGSPLYETYGGMYALTGVPDSVVATPENPDGWIPNEIMFTGFRGWDFGRIGPPGLTGEEKRALWRATHPAWEVATRPDYFIESAISGPFLLPKTTFLLGLKYEDTQFAFPLGPRDSYTDWNAQLKLTTRFTPSTRLSVSGMYANVKTINSGSTSSYSGAVFGQTDRFNFLTNTRTSVEQQAALIGSSWGFLNLYNIGRTQFYDKRFIVAGARLNHTLSTTAFANLELQFSYDDANIRPFMFSTQEPGAYIELAGQQWLNLPSQGYPDGNVTPIDDELGMFRLTGGANYADSSYTWTAGLKGDVTKQVNRHHQIETGFDVQYQHMFVYSGVNRGTTFQYEPGFYQYYTATPLQVSLYAQDKLEYQGMVATVGLRAEYFDPMTHGYDVSLPLDPDFSAVYGEVYHSLPGALNSYERWVAWRELLDEPPGWPVKDAKGQLRISPRIGTSFPITTAAKLYFNYGVFYQRANTANLYNRIIQTGNVAVPNPSLKPERTTAFEFGYEQSLFNNYVLNVTFYYKDVVNKPMAVTYYSYFEDNIVRTYSNDAYRDVRGIELRFEKNFGRFLTFWGNYDYQVISGGTTGLNAFYENPLKAREQERFPDMFRSQPRPRAYVSVNLHTPNDFGPRILGNYPIGGIYINPLWEWRDGGYAIWNPEEPNPDRQLRVDIVDYSNVDLRVSKMLNLPVGSMELIMTVNNLLNTRRLYTGNMLPQQLANYKNSLHLPFKSDELKGNDKWGEWDKDHIDVGWYTAPVFLNPRRFLFGVRLQY